MLPYVEIFGKTLPMYSVTTALGVFAAVIYYKLQEHRCKELSADLELAFLSGLIGAAIGAKLLSVITVLPDIIRDLPMLHKNAAVFVQTYLLSGFVFYGGLFGCVIGVYVYCRFSKVSFDAIARILLPTFPLIHGFGRVGCLCMGCCYGKPAGNSPFAIIFEHSLIAPNGVPLIPVQLMEVCLEAFLFVLLAVLSRKNCSGKRMLAVYCAIYGFVRFLLEYLRGDEYRGFLFGLSTSQIISIFTVMFSFLLFQKIERRSER